MKIKKLLLLSTLLIGISSQSMAMGLSAPIESVSVFLDSTNYVEYLKNYFKEKLTTENEKSTSTIKCQTDINKCLDINIENGEKIDLSKIEIIGDKCSFNFNNIDKNRGTAKCGDYFNEDFKNKKLNN